jgi:hypothetical protein
MRGSLFSHPKILNDVCLECNHQASIEYLAVRDDFSEMGQKK